MMYSAPPTKVLEYLSYVLSTLHPLVSTPGLGTVHVLSRPGPQVWGYLPLDRPADQRRYLPLSLHCLTGCPLAQLLLSSPIRLALGLAASTLAPITANPSLFSPPNPARPHPPQTSCLASTTK